MQGEPSNSLLCRIAAGDPRAVEACLDEYGGTILALARRYLTTVKGDVEGAVQEVFIELWKNAHRFDPSRGSEPAFVMTMAHRRLIDRRRWHASRFSVGELAMEPAAGASAASASTPATNPGVGAELRDEARDAAAALERLPTDEQQLLRLSIYSGLSHERISIAVGLPVGTVKTRIRRGLDRLRRSLALSREATASSTASAMPTRQRSGPPGFTQGVVDV